MMACLKTLHSLQRIISGIALSQCTFKGFAHGGGVLCHVSTNSTVPLLTWGRLRFQPCRSFKTDKHSINSGKLPAPPTTKTSCRQNFHEDCETLINKQINLELYASYVYLAMAYHFDREDVALHGFHKYFKLASDEEREHAQLLMKYQNTRGGTVLLENILQPTGVSSSSPLEAIGQALELEKNVYQNLLELHEMASKRNDPALSNFLEEHFLQEQINANKELSDMITNLKRVGPGLGEYLFDQNLRNMGNTQNAK